MIMPINPGPSPVHVCTDELRCIPTPTPTHTWHPIPHSLLLDEVESQLRDSGAVISGKALVVSHEGLRFFGVLHVHRPNAPEGCVHAVGIRNSSDQCFAAGIASGLRVLVCSNLSFAGDVVFKRRHTAYIAQDLPNMVESGVAHLDQLWERQSQQVRAYKDKRVSNMRAHDIVVQAMDRRVVPASQVPAVLEDYRNPTHQEFEPRNLWSLFNSFTEILKQRSNPFLLSAKTQTLHEICDAHCGIQPGV